MSSRRSTVPRKSADELSLSSVVPVDGAPVRRLEPPESLTESERVLFQQVVNACAAKHFVETDGPLLVSYVQATLMAHAMARDPDAVAAWVQAVRTQMALATKLRLSPQARTDPKTTGRQPPPRIGLAPWER
jgi:hypothetical protein